MKLLLVASVAVCLFALQAAAQAQPVFHDEGGILAKLEQTPALAPLAKDLRDNPGTVIALFQSKAFQQLAANPPAVFKLLESPQFLTIAQNETAFEELVKSEEFQGIITATQAEAPATVSALLSTTMTPSSGDPTTDVESVESELASLLPPVAAPVVQPPMPSLAPVFRHLGHVNHPIGRRKMLARQRANV